MSGTKWAHLVEAALWLAAGVGAWRYASEVWSVATTHEPLYDFIAYFAAAQGVIEGRSIYEAPLYRYRYPPTLALLLTPLTSLEPLAAQRLWTILDQGFLAAAVWLSLRLLPRRPTRAESALLLAAGFGFYPLYTQVKLGQMGNLLFLLLAWMATAWHRGERGRAGWPIALAGALKLYPLGLSLWFARQRAWRPVAVVFLGFAAILVLPELILRGGWLADYLHSLPVMFSAGADPIKADNQSLFAVFARLVGAPGWLSLGFALAATLSLGAFVLTLACTPDGGMSGDELAISIAASALPLAWANPAGWSHNYIVALLAAPALVVRLGDRLRRDRRRADVTAAIALAAAWVCLSQPYRLPRLLGHGELQTDAVSLLLRSTLLFGSIVLWLVLLRELNRGAGRPPAAA